MACRPIKRPFVHCFLSVIRGEFCTICGGQAGNCRDPDTPFIVKMTSFAHVPKGEHGATQGLWLNTDISLLAGLVSLSKQLPSTSNLKPLLYTTLIRHPILVREGL